MTAPLDVWRVCGRRLTPTPGSGCTCTGNDPTPLLAADALTRLNNPDPAGLAVGDHTCRHCGGRLTTTYPNQTLHPACDPDPPGWTEQQLAHWCRRAARRSTPHTTGDTP